MAMQSILEQAGGSFNSTRENVAFVAIVLVNKLGPQQLDDEKLELLAFFTV